MQEGDMDAVFALQTAAYVPEMVEALALLRARRTCAADSAWLIYDKSGALAAYLMAYRSQRQRIAALGQDFPSSQVSDALYLHDLVVAPQMTGLGLGRKLVAHALAYARANGLGAACLVSVQQTRAFWESLGFIAQASLSPEQQANLQTYAGPAVYYIKEL